MKLFLKSKQDYGTHIEEYAEKFECSVEQNENSIIINFNEGQIFIEENKITQARGENKIIIEVDKTSECDYETENGMFVLDIEGIQVEKNVSNAENIDSILETKNKLLVAKAKYKIIIVGVEPYINEIEIMLGK